MAATAVGLLVLVGCGDDGNGPALRAPRASEPAAEFRASQATTLPPEPVRSGDPAPADSVPTTSTMPRAPAVEPTGVVVPVIALDNSFRPQLVEIDAGDEVVWENRGLNEHDVLYVAGDDWGVEVEGFQPGDVYAHVFTEPGEYRYFCSIHGTEDVGMIGTVVVRG